VCGDAAHENHGDVEGCRDDVHAHRAAVHACRAAVPLCVDDVHVFVEPIPPHPSCREAIALTAARTTPPTNVEATGSASLQGSVDRAGPDGDGGQLGDTAGRREGVTGSVHEGAAPDCHRSLVSSERTSSSAMLLLAAGSADVARTAAAVEALERQDHGARSAAEEENAWFAAEMRAELAERDALWAKYPREMSALEAAEDAFFHAPTRGRDRAAGRLARARKALEAAKARNA
jgi:hypothetical protein